jgi:hypothetical protein
MVPCPERPSESSNGYSATDILEIFTQKRQRLKEKLHDNLQDVLFLD